MEHALEAKELMTHLNIDKVHIVGRFYGGEVAMRFAIDYSEIVKSISVIDSVSQLNKIQCPALVVCGEDYILKPVKFSKIIADRITKSEFVMIPDC